MESTPRPDDPEAPVEDAVDQSVPIDEEVVPHGMTNDPEAPIADALDQAEVVPEDDDDRR